MSQLPSFGSLPQRTAAQLMRRITEDPDAKLPSIAALAVEYEVSVKTMWKAVHILAGQGLVECRKGLGVSLPGRMPQRQRAGGSVDDLFNAVRAMITDGTYQTGEALPKVNFFVLSDRRSRSTVISALRRLGEAGLTHKRGRRWIVGPGAKTRGSPSVGPTGAPVVLLLVLNQVYWKSLFQSSFTSPFISVFLSELRKHHIGLSLATTHIPISERGALPGGAEKTPAIVRSLGQRYQGAIMIYLEPQHSMPLLAMLGRFGKPVIDFNPTNEPRAPIATHLRHRKGACRYLHLDEAQAVRLALTHLVQLGHRTIGIPEHDVPGFEWTRRRMATFNECASAHFPDLRLVSVKQTEPWWGRLGPESSIAEFLAAVEESTDGAGFGSGPALSARGRQTLLAATPSLAALVQRKDVTAIVALNNELARKYYYWFKLMDIEVPRRLSLISFDDTPESVTFPITTIDFGFARLGYLAAHILIGDIPVKADREGNIPGVCELVDRGSVRRLGVI